MSRADAPTNIIWENLEIGKCESFCWSFFIQIFVAIVVIIVFIMIYLVKEYQSTLSVSYDCSSFSDVRKDTLNPKNGVALECLCSTIGLFNTYNITVCDSWVWQYIGWTFLTILVSMLVSFMNFAIRTFLKKLALFERYKTLTGMNKSILVKLFAATTINLVVLIFIINLNLQTEDGVWSLTTSLPLGTYYFFNGDYMWVNWSWYISVGYSIFILCVSNFLISLTFAYGW